LQELVQGSLVRQLLLVGLLSSFLFPAQIGLAQPVKVFVSILPQKYFVEKIGGDLVEVSVMVQPGASPATYEPKPRQMVALAKTRIYFAIGVPFEAAWLEKVAATNSRMQVVHTETGIERMPMKPHYRHGGVRPQVEIEHRHDHLGVKDPHIWLSPPLVTQQARSIFCTLAALDPHHLASYEINYKKFIIELVDLDLELKRVFDRNGEHTEFMVFHPSWGYFARAYGLRQVPIEIEGKEPKPEELKDLVKYAKARGAKVVFVQPQFSQQAAQMIAQAIGGQVAQVDPLAPDWANNLREVAFKFKEALR
jgi:zinc transport system substrate-binding protein